MTELYSDATDAESMAKRLQKLERQILALKTALSLENASIGAGGTRWHSGGSAVFVDGGGVEINDGGELEVNDGGNISINDGGELVMTDEDGNVVVKLGLVLADDTLSRGIELNYDNGQLGFSIHGSPGLQSASVWDYDGSIVFATNLGTQGGLARPYLDYRLVPAFDAESSGSGTASLWPSTAATSATVMMIGDNPVFHKEVDFGIRTSTAGGGSASWRLDIHGQTVASGSGGATQTVSVPSNVGTGQTVDFELYGWCSGGATRAWFQCDRLYGIQS